MADITRGPDQFSRLMSRIEDGSARVLPGEEQPNALQRSSEELARLHAAVRETARASGRPAKGKLTVTIEVTAGAGSGEASPCEHSVAITTTLPKRPKLSRPAWVDDEGNVLGSEPRQLELTAVVGGEKTTPKASRRVV